MLAALLLCACGNDGGANPPATGDASVEGGAGDAQATGDAGGDVVIVVHADAGSDGGDATTDDGSPGDDGASGEGAAGDDGPAPGDDGPSPDAPPGDDGPSSDAPAEAAPDDAGLVCNTGTHACNGSCLPDLDDPQADPCVVSDATGVFVSPAGSDTSGAGTMVAPYKTLGFAVTKALAGLKRVYACIGTYGEQASLTSAADGLKVFGGLDCGNGWKYVGSSGASATIVASPQAAAAPGTALTVTGPMTAGVIFEDVGFVAASGHGAGDSSVAVFVTAQAVVTLARANVKAGDGVTGATGSAASNWTGSAPAGTAGGPGSPGGDGSGGVNAGCADLSTSTGGRGSHPALDGGAFSAATAGSSQPAVPSPAANAGVDGLTCGVGGPGMNGPAPAAGGAGATSAGSIAVTGWLAGSGAAGANGGVAQGGGGGGQQGIIGSGTGIGGGGGAGGCGGGGGKGGSTGGSSLGILAHQATVVLVSSLVTTGVAGGGGAGGPGQPGQAGATGGAGGNLQTSCMGGTGGTGAGGAGGGGGGGGDSVGVAWLGAAPPIVDGAPVSQDQATHAGITPGAAGAAGGGGSGGAGPAGNSPAGTPGAAGVSFALRQYH